MELSKCCQASIKNISTDEGTGYMVCTECNKPCDMDNGNKLNMSKTIKERHLEAIDHLTKYSAHESAQKCEAITEEICIKFAQWIKDKENLTMYAGGWMFISDPVVYSSDSLYELFIAQSGL